MWLRVLLNNDACRCFPNDARRGLETGGGRPGTCKNRARGGRDETRVVLAQRKVDRVSEKWSGWSKVRLGRYLARIG